MALPTQWNFGETSAKEFGQTIDRANWRIVMPFHLAESREQAMREVAAGLQKWQNEYIVGILGTPQRPTFPDGYEAAKRMSDYGGAIFGTPEDALERIARLQKLSGGFGTILSFAHDWATRRKCSAATNYYPLRNAAMPRPDQTIEASAARVTANKKELMEKAGGAILKAIRDYNAVHPRQK